MGNDDVSQQRQRRALFKLHVIAPESSVQSEKLGH